MGEGGVKSPEKMTVPFFIYEPKKIEWKFNAMLTAIIYDIKYFV